MIHKHLDKNNLHHAYLIEGARDEVVLEILEFLKDLGIKTNANSDFTHIAVDSFKIEDARNLKSYASEKSFSNEKNAKKIFLISANSFLLEAQNSLLKMFEEPIENTHLFIVVPEIDSLLKTLVSRFYVISDRQGLVEEEKNAERFIKMPLQQRIDFIKELLVEVEDEDDEGKEIVVLDSARSKALKFLNSLELTLHNMSVSKRHFDTGYFEQIFKVRKFLRMPGSSPKTLLESVALIIPEK